MNKRFLVCLLVAAVIMNALVIGCAIFIASGAPTNNSIPSWDERKPQMQVVSNAPDNFQISLKTYEKTNWTTLTNVFTTRAEAQEVINESMREARIRYDMLRAMAEALDPHRSN